MLPTRRCRQHPHFLGDSSSRLMILVEVDHDMQLLLDGEPVNDPDSLDLALRSGDVLVDGEHRPLGEAWVRGSSFRTVEGIGPKLVIKIGEAEVTILLLRTARLRRAP